MITKALNDASLFAAGGPFSIANAADCAANFPALVGAWLQEDVTDNTSVDWVDRTSGLIIRATNAALRKDANGVYVGHNLGIGTMVGTRPTPNSKQPIVMVHGYWTGAAESVTLGGAPGFSVAHGGGAAYFHRSTGDYSTNGVITPTYPLVDLVTMHGDTDADAEVRKYIADATNATLGTSLKSVTDQLGSLQGVMGQYGNSWSLPGQLAGNRVQSIFLWQFTTPPTDVYTATKWMAANPGKAYPAWAGKS